MFGQIVKQFGEWEETKGILHQKELNFSFVKLWTILLSTPRPHLLTVRNIMTVSTKYYSLDYRNKVHHSFIFPEISYLRSGINFYGNIMGTHFLKILYLI